MSEEDRSAPLAPTYWVRVEKRSMDTSNNDWKQCCLVEMTGSDNSAMLADAMLRHSGSLWLDHRVTIWHTSDCEGTPLADTVRPGTGIAGMAVRSAEELSAMSSGESGAGESVADGGPKEQGEPGADTPAGLISAGAEPWQITLQLSSVHPFAALIAAQATGGGPFVRQGAEDELISAGRILAEALDEVRRGHAMLARKGDWVMYADALDVIAAAASTYVSTYVFWKNLA